jgi:polysaccharide deacetylase 2 family uncharacterized protein YibQ
MPPRKKKTRSKPRPKASASSRFPKVLAAALVVVLIAGVAVVKYFQSPSGRARLVDAGFHDYYAEVQADIGEALRQGLGEFGLRGRVGERAAVERTRGKTVRVLRWRIACDESCDYVLINVALTKAVKRAGGTVRRSEETDEGNTFLFNVGTRKFDTHRLTFTRAGSAVSIPPPERRPKLALVIDDLGYSRGGVVDSILSMDLPLTISVLPSLPYSTFALERAQQEGKCTLLHLPMEPDEEQASDLNMVRTDMNDRAIERLVSGYIQSLPGIEGVNNHQGSRATADRRVMEAVLGVIKRYDLFFLDSLTSSESVAYTTAVDIGVRAARNSVFLDADTDDPEVVERRLRQLVETARKHGSAVGIGHPRRWTLEALLRSETFLKNNDVQMVYLTDIADE